MGIPDTSHAVLVDGRKRDLPSLSQVIPASRLHIPGLQLTANHCCGLCWFLLLLPFNILLCPSIYDFQLVSFVQGSGM